MRYNLSGADWKLCAFDRNVPLQGKSMELGQTVLGNTPWIPCTVPGGVAPALYRAGLIEYPYFELNTMKCEWIENRWWVYDTVIPRPRLEGKYYRLVFHGVDYAAIVYVNGVKLGEHEGMYEPFSFDITKQFLESETLNIHVVLREAPKEMGQSGWTARTTTQKSRCNYRWDFCPRFVNLGIWDDVEIVTEEEYSLETPYVHSDVTEDGTGLITVQGRVAVREPVGAEPRVKAVCSLDGKTVAEQVLPVSDNGSYCSTLRLENPALWWPNGMGEHPLYQVTLTLLDDSKVYDEYTCSQGIRRLRYVQNEGAPADALPYTLEINGKRIYTKGINTTPMDCMYGDVSRKRYESILRVAVLANANLLRVWGGGVIEKEDFYDLCDRNGLLVWQEFIQSSCGINNIPSKDPAFLKLLRDNSAAALKNRRNHTCLTYWGGGNELMDDSVPDFGGREDFIPVTYQDKNISMLKGLVEELDGERLFFPSSPSGPNFYQSDKPLTSHDVHGEWVYLGNPRHYEYYSSCDNLFNSEVSCEGMSGMRTINRALAPENRHPVAMRDNMVWRSHGDYWCCYDRNNTFFGEVKEMKDYIDSTQWIQAESLRYSLEANRRRAPKNSGSILWQLAEPWPNISNTVIYSYYNEAKMVLYWIRKAYEPLHVSLEYKRLDYQPGETFEASVWLSLDPLDGPRQTHLSWEALDMEGHVLASGEADREVPDGRSSRCLDLSFPVPQLESRLFAVRLRAEDGKRSSETVYYFSTCKEKLYAPARELRGAQLQVQLLREEEGARVYRVANTGTQAALHVKAEETANAADILCDDNFFTLFPGESREITVYVYPKYVYGFDENADLPEDAKPEITFSHLFG